MVLSVADYQVIEQLSRENKTILYRAHSLSEGKSVLIKTFHADYPSPKDVLQLKREFAVAKRASSPGMVEPIALEAHQNTWLLMLEDCSGVTLEHRLARGPLHLVLFLEIALRLAESVLLLHRKNIIHKDIKPANILVNQDAGTVKLTNFASASLLSGERSELLQPDLLEGSLSYMSPEQTGRLDRPIDFRSDLYSLGVTFYEMVTGKLPFVADEPMSLIYQHLTIEPAPPHHLDVRIPRAVSDIIMKCLAKNAEDRYQSAHGIKHDLEICLHHLVDGEGQIPEFVIGQVDRSEHFRLTDVLYGREQELQVLSEAFQCSRRGEFEAVLVSGSAGVGKSSLVGELKRTALQEQAFFIAGKFDQHMQVTYQGVSQALNQLIHQLLAESEEQVARWKEEILESVGPSVQALIEVMPALELIVGKQSALPILTTLETQSRFRLALQNLLSVVATAGHPLVLFLDDLQWADQASLNLISFLLSDGNIPHLLVIGSYRHDELEESNRWLGVLDELRQRECQMEEIHLTPLTGKYVQQLIADALQCSPEQAVMLAHVVMEKGSGNPFFVKQFLQSLHEQGILSIEQMTGEWQWDLDAIRQEEVSSDQVDFMLSKIRQLPEGTQDLLKAAACIGHTFELETLHATLEWELFDLANNLLLAVEVGVLKPKGTAYKWLYGVRAGDAIEEWFDHLRVTFQFMHDRVQQVAYELQTAEERKMVHLKVGRWLNQQSRAHDMEDRLFDRVNHLNEAIDFIHDFDEREELARNNLEAGRRAKASTAYEQALSYLRRGIELLSDTLWETQYELAYDLYRERFELEHLCGHSERADAVFDVLMANARSVLEKSEVYKIRIALYTFEDRMAEAIRVGKEALRSFGFKGNLKMNRLKMWWAVRKLRRLLKKKSWNVLANAPAATDPQVIAIMDIMAFLFHPSFYVDPNLYRALNFKIIEYSLAHGFTERSSGAYAGSGLVIMKEFADYHTADDLSRLGVELERRFTEQNGTVAIRNLQFYASTLQHWTTHNRLSIDSFLTVAKRALAAGDLLRSGHSLVSMIQRQMYGGMPLDELKQEIHRRMSTLRRGKSEWAMQAVNMTLGLIYNLQGVTPGVANLSHADFDEKLYCETVLPKHHSSLQSRYYYCKLMLLYLWEEYEEILRMIPVLSEEILAEESDFVFLLALTLTTMPGAVTNPEQTEERKKLQEYRKQMKKWAQVCPENFLHRSLLLEAEEARLGRRDREAMDLYDQAISTASKNGYVQHAAMANECAARFYMRMGKKHLATTYLVAAHYGYLRWGAVVKANQLAEQHPAILKTASNELSGSAHVDFQSVMKAARTISGEIVLDQLLERLIEIVVENAGAQKVLLLIQNEGELQVVARKHPSESKVSMFESTPWQECRDLSSMVVQYVSRKLEAVVLHDAVRDDVFSKDPYIRDVRPKSLLCLPILNQGRMLGMIYLENNLMTHGFTAERLEVMNLLSAQVAVSIENAMLYRRQVRLNQAYDRFVPHQFLRLLEKKSITDVELGDHVQMEMTVMFADIRSFTALSERMTPEENFHFLNDFLGRMEPVIKAHGGFVDKYIGDSIMALFEKDTDDAVCASIELLRQLHIFNEERKMAGLEAIRIGIGNNSGMLMLGTLGGPERMDSTVISDAVNLASRIEEMTKTYHVPLLISEYTYARLLHPENYCIRPVDSVTVRGKSESVMLYEVFDADPVDVREIKNKIMPLYQQAYRAYWSNQVIKALELFETCANMLPDDPVIQMYLERCRAM